MQCRPFLIIIIIIIIIVKIGMLGVACNSFLNVNLEAQFFSDLGGLSICDILVLNTKNIFEFFDD